MLDTVILQIDYNKFYINEYESFGASKEQILSSKSPFKKWINNPSKKDAIYKPRLTLIKRGVRFVLKVEFSAPKLIFGNNIDELDDSDFDLVIKTLRERLQSMGVLIFSANLENSEVISFHPSKNIPLSKGYTSNMAIKELNKIDCSKRFDFDEKNYRNNGEVLQFYTRSHSLVIYDKINDLVKPQKRATDKDQTKQQLSIFDYIKKNEQALDILRIEIRLSLKQKINKVMEFMEQKTNPTFKDIFSKELCQKIVNSYWDNFFGNNLFLFNSNSSPQSILQLIFLKYPKTKTLKAITAVGLYMLCKDEDGMKGFRQIIDSHRRKRADWQTVKENLKLFENEIFTGSTWGFIKDVRRELRDFKPYRLTKTENLMCKEK
jgi:hypothetical protein